MYKLLINSNRTSLTVLTALLMTGQFLFLSQAAAQQRIKEIAAVAGERSNQLIGYGLVVGLDGSGDQTTQSPFTLQSTLAMLQSLGVAIPPGVSAQTRNIAAVMVTSELPALARPGQKIDLTISSIGNAKSLRGGTLLMTPLRGADGQIYALAQGSIFVGGAGASAGGSSATVNHLSVGRITGGGLIERALPTQAVGEFVQLDLYQSDYSLMRRVAEAIAKRFGAVTPRPFALPSRMCGSIKATSALMTSTSPARNPLMS